MRNQFFLVLIAALGMCLLVGTPAFGTVYTGVPVYLDGLQETPPVATPATGFALVDFDDSTGMMTVYDGTFSDLIGSVNNAHVHGYAAAGAGPAGVVFGLTFAGGTSGTFSGSGTSDIAQTLAGLTYINIHSTFRPGGEIRGQIVIPEPMSLGTVGLAALAMLRRRR